MIKNKRGENMTKITRKLFISILTVAFALVTLGATTFAWFTLSNKAQIQQFEAQVSAGAGIEISLNGTNFKSTITTAEIQQRIDQNQPTSRLAMDDVTSADGLTFKYFDTADPFEYDEDEEITGIKMKDAEEGWIWFDLYFRSPEENVRVYLLDNSYIKSTGINWVSDAAFQFDSVSSVAVGNTRQVYAANALRISMEEYTGIVDSEDSQTGLNEGVRVFELEPDPLVDTHNQVLGTEPKLGYGSVAYYNSKYPLDALTQGLLDGIVLPGYTVTSDDLKDPAELNAKQSPNAVATLRTPSGTPTYYYGMIKVKMWLEGWDPDMYNSIMADRMQIYLNFGGSSVKTINIGNDISMTVEEHKSIPAPAVTGFGEEDEDEEYMDNFTSFTYSSSNTAVVTVDANGELTAVGAGTAIITVKSTYTDPTTGYTDSLYSTITVTVTAG
jgi:hypothetical protein